MTWRNVSIVLFIFATWLLWRDCSRTSPACEPVPAAHEEPASRHAHTWDDTHETRDTKGEEEAPPTEASGLSINGFKLPSWIAWLAPHGGEDLRSYRDRMMPLALAAIAPHRARVARSRDDFAAAVHLDTRQRQVLDTATQEAASQIEEKVMSAVLSGDFAPANFKPMTAVRDTRDLLEIVDKANQRFVDSLTAEQRAELAQHPFDFSDYLVFSTKWEDQLNAL